MKSPSGARPPKTRAQGRPLRTTTVHGRDMILQATMRLLKTTSPSSVTREAIAKAANVDPGLIRYYFGGKSELMLYVTKLISEENLKKIDSIKNVASTPQILMRNRIRILFEMHRLYPYYYEICYKYVIPGKSESAKNLRRDMILPYYRELSFIVAKGVEDGVFMDIDPKFLHVSLLGMCHFFLNNKILFTELLEAKIDDEVEQAYVKFVSDFVIFGLQKRNGVSSSILDEIPDQPPKTRGRVKGDAAIER